MSTSCVRSTLLCVRESLIKSDKIVLKQQLFGLINITSARTQKKKKKRIIIPMSVWLDQDEEADLQRQQ